MKSAICGAVLLAGAPLVLSAQTEAAPAAEEGVALTVYNQNFAVVKEVRSMELGEKVSAVQFRDVAKQIDPTSVFFKSLTDPAGTSVLEQNYEFDLVNADKILDKYIDRQIAVLTKQGQRYSGTLLSFDAQQLVLQGTNGLAMVQRPDNVQNIEFGALPEGLLTRPTLVWKISTAKTGKHTVQVTYQTSGISWQADYTAVVNPNDTKMDLAAWVTLTNQSGGAYKNARIKLIAGDVQRIQPAPPRRYMKGMEMAAMGVADNSFQEKPFFEYHMYTLGRPTTVNEDQVKQIELFPAAGNVPVTKRYVFEPDGRYWHRYGDSNSYKANVYMEFKNSKESNLGMPLPKGKVRLYKQDPADKGLEFVGEDQIDHTPKDEDLRLYVGDAFDVVGEKNVVNQRQEGNWSQTEIKIVLRNHKSENITVRVREHLGGNWEIKRKSREFTKVDANTIEFDVPVAKDGKSEFSYTVENRW